MQSQLRKKCKLQRNNENQRQITNNKIKNRKILVIFLVLEKNYKLI